MPLIYIEQSYVRKLELDQAKVKKIGSIMSEKFGDTCRGEDPKIDIVFDLIDDLLGIEAKTAAITFRADRKRVEGT